MPLCSVHVDATSHHPSVVRNRVRNYACASTTPGKETQLKCRSKASTRDPSDRSVIVIDFSDTFTSFMTSSMMMLIGSHRMNSFFFVVAVSSVTKRLGTKMGKVAMVGKLFRNSPSSFKPNPPSLWGRSRTTVKIRLENRIIKKMQSKKTQHSSRHVLPCCLCTISQFHSFLRACVHLSALCPFPAIASTSCSVTCRCSPTRASPSSRKKSD